MVNGTGSTGYRKGRLFRQRIVLHDEIVCVNGVVMDDHTATAAFLALR